MYAEIAKSDLRILRARIRGAAIFLCAATLSIAIMQPAARRRAGLIPNRLPLVRIWRPLLRPLLLSRRNGRRVVWARPGRYSPSPRGIQSPHVRSGDQRSGGPSTGDYQRPGLRPGVFQHPPPARDYRQAERSRARRSRRSDATPAMPGPPRLSPSELDSLTGRINWPILLQHEMFQAPRAGLEELFDRWAVSRNLGAADRFGAQEYLAILQLTGEMIEQLRQQIQLLPPQDYLNAKRFLESLAFEVQNSNRPEGPMAANVSQTTQ